MSLSFAQFGSNAGFIKELYEYYRTDPALVGSEWIEFFTALEGAADTGCCEQTRNGTDVSAPQMPATHRGEDAGKLLDLNERALRLVAAYRKSGHRKARVNPLSKGIPVFSTPSDLQPEQYGFTDSEQQSAVRCDRFQDVAEMRLADLISNLEQTYCDTIGYEYDHLTDPTQREFLRERIESRGKAKAAFSVEEQKRILLKLVEAETMEGELHKKYVGQKRFSLQGGDTLLPMLDTVLSNCPAAGVKHLYIGMPHRGRLNVLVNTVGKPLSDLFNEFEDQTATAILGAGDVKYHLGYDNTHTTPAGEKVRITLAPNPSHLEFIGSVVEGICRAHQDIEHDASRTAVLPVILHGDAAFIGQGIVYETFNLMSVPTYATGGSLHIVVNNQVGFTTDPTDARSTTYCTDAAKGFDVPIFHVNAEDPEACCFIAALALEFRTRFQKDVVMDLICYRKYGHNEGDDPNFTQPLLYTEIVAKKTIGSQYADSLTAAGRIDAEQYKSFVAGYTACFKEADAARKPGAQGEACPTHGRFVSQPAHTAVTKEKLNSVADLLAKFPEGFTPNAKLLKILEKRVEAVHAGEGIDWGTAEALAFGSLLSDGVSVRLSGQDCGRGTFSHRHLLISHAERLEKYSPLTPLAQQHGTRFDIMNSTLSEAAVMGFEFGYSSIATKTLTLWEGQFGDFANGAQVLIDQFLSSSESKWWQRSGVTLLLPHGFEGQGPEHSSARLERYLQLCAEGNMRVCHPTTAAQHFHLMRRQGLSAIQRPLVVMTPKSLLRSADAAASLTELTSGSFKPVLVNNFGDAAKGNGVVILVSGKAYYDVKATVEKQKGNARVLRIEELYPFPEAEITAALKGMKAKQFIWVQEEPANMGGWFFVQPRLEKLLGAACHYVGRTAAASPATGSGKAHAKELQQFLGELVARL